jgi:hypothetical protein
MRLVLWFHRPQFMYAPYASVRVMASSALPPTAECSALFTSPLAFVQVDIAGEAGV